MSGLKIVPKTRFKSTETPLSELFLVLAGFPDGGGSQVDRASIHVWLDRRGDTPKVRITLEAAPDSPLPQCTTGSKSVSFKDLYLALHELADRKIP